MNNGKTNLRQKNTLECRNEESRDEAVWQAVSKMSISFNVSDICFIRSLMILCMHLVNFKKIIKKISRKRH